MSAKPAEVRVKQAVMLLVGAVVLSAFVAPSDRRFYWTPLVLGLAYLAAAVSGGRRGGHWATACVLVGWGAAVALVGATRPDLDAAGLYLAGAGVGTGAGMLLQRAGVEVNPMGLATTIVAAGLILALAPRASDVLEDARTYAALLGVVAAANLVLAGRGALAARRRRAHRGAGPHA